MPTYNENWYPDDKIDALVELARSTRDLPGSVIEIGAWEGRSTTALMQAFSPDIVHVIDTWAGSPSDASFELAKERDVYATFLANIKEAGNNFCIHRSDWRVAFASWRPRLRFVHLDGEHTYEQVRDNIAAALPLMVEDGILCGDDYSVHWPGVRRAVEEVFGIGGFGVECDALWWKRL